MSKVALTDVYEVDLRTTLERGLLSRRERVRVIVIITGCVEAGY